MPPPKAKRVPLRLTKRPLPLRWHTLISAPGLSPISAMRLAKSGVPLIDTTRTGVDQHGLELQLSPRTVACPPRAVAYVDEPMRTMKRGNS